jgi:cation-transporting P-type ATPase C
MTWVVAAAAGRVRVAVPWLRDRADLAAVPATRLTPLAPRALVVHVRTGNVVVWLDPHTEPAEVVARLAAAPEVAVIVEGTSGAVVHRAADAGVARLVVGGAVLAGVAFAKVLLRRPAPVRGPAAEMLAGVAMFTGMPFLRGSVATLSGRGGNGTALLITAATGASLVLRQNVVALTVLWLLNIGEFLQELTLRRTRRAIEDLLAVGDQMAWLVRDEVLVEVATDSLLVGDVVAVPTHRRIPVDGVVVAGQALAAQAAITGEPLPVAVGVGGEVFAGTVVTDGALRVRATRVGSDTVVGRIVERVERADADRAPVATIATRFTRRFVPVSFAMATLTLLVTGDPRRAMTMLLIACPCAAGLATPTAISAAIGNGARRGVLIKGGAHLENAGRIDAVVFDKTGTLTMGRPLVTDVIALSETFDSDQVLALAASGEIHARHPLAQAVVRHTAERRIEIPLHASCEVVLGMGMRADVDGRRLLVGSPALMRREGVPMPEAAADWVRRLRRQSRTALCIAVQDELIGVIGVADAVRAESAAVIAQLRTLGIRRVVMLTGDAQRNAATVAELLGIEEYRARTMPEDKLAVIRDLQAQGHRVAMIGDGTNDAPALAAADLSMAMGATASDVAIETADITLATADLQAVADTIALSRHTLRVIRQNYALAIGVNTIGLLTGAGGRLNPVLAAVLHNASSVAVVANSARLVGHRPQPRAPGEPTPPAPIPVATADPRAD